MQERGGGAIHDADIELWLPHLKIPDGSAQKCDTGGRHGPDDEGSLLDIGDGADVRVRLVQFGQYRRAFGVAQMGKAFTGIERERKYFDIACERIACAQAQGTLIPPEVPTMQQQEIDA